MNKSVTIKISNKSQNTKVKNEISEIRNKYRIKTLWLFPIIVLAIICLSSLFIDPILIRVSISIILGFFPWLAITDKLFSTRYTHLRTQLLVMLQTLCTSVSSGYSIEKSLMTVRPIIEHTFGKKSILVKPLCKLEHNINMHRDLEKSLDEFVLSLSFPEVIPVFHALGISGKIGNNSLEILRSSCQMLSEMSAVQSEIDAQNSGKNAEAAILCLMPFGITFALNNVSSTYMSEAKNTPIGSILLLVAFILCIISSALLFKYMTHGFSIIKASNSKEKEEKEYKYLLTSVVQKLFPTSFISSRYELFSELSINPTKEYEKYLRKQLITTTGVTITFLLFLLATNKNPLLVIAAPVLLLYLNYFDIKKKAELRKEEIMKDIPLFICLINTLLEAGILLPRAIEICSEAFPNNRSLSYEIKNLRALILSGISAPDAIEKLSLRIKVPEAQSALLLISRYGRLGANEVLNLLSLQASACWNLCRNAARKKQERESLGMLLPMTLDFICVLIVATTPAIISLGI
ncbi:MAG: hypothetical protein MJ166_10580 [Clostridia bacterium]|nr:hypothetical protein [Clostridia bacterium]